MDENVQRVGESMSTSEFEAEKAQAVLENAKQMGFWLACTAAGWLSCALGSKWYFTAIVPFYFLIVAPYKKAAERAEDAYINSTDD